MRENKAQPESQIWKIYFIQLYLYFVFLIFKIKHRNKQKKKRETHAPPRGRTFTRT